MIQAKAWAKAKTRPQGPHQDRKNVSTSGLKRAAKKEDCSPCVQAFVFVLGRSGRRDAKSKTSLPRGTKYTRNWRVSFYTSQPRQELSSSFKAPRKDRKQICFQIFCMALQIIIDKELTGCELWEKRKLLSTLEGRICKPVEKCPGLATIFRISR